MYEIWILYHEKSNFATKIAMKRLKKYFTIWWVPIVSYIIPFGVFVLGLILRYDFIIDIALVLFFLNILGNIISAIKQIIIKKWFFVIPQFIISAVLYLILSVIFQYSPPDYYGAHKEIPSNIHFEKLTENIPTKDDIINSQDFILINSNQPGIYEYYTSHQPREKGFFYIKVYEITSNDRLSEDRINENSKVFVNYLNDSVHSGKFTIYEGSWGDKYGARIELWFKPDNGEEYKVIQKNYIVEGWMR
ncbi:hypothetical protein EDL99_06720 [Ornithobacterium rhinotracheale]|uniref:hypothetical protein n=1 Tax=Ornithobacterium rhinotracheale TaxID=28251 RepID=UPI00129C9619|nr:hypothetical protein [Ornithobacterium rhinotracheale]MRJ08559.1 hypothetical protein [Ornithobacterium rhinotracheale]UOH76831.1 hypothetical protein MT996_06280 [Ornithobacterium rhinotracheale]